MHQDVYIWCKGFSAENGIGEPSVNCNGIYFIKGMVIFLRSYKCNRR